ncbi:hypothetical protein [Brevundimonas sp. SGAir0440]|uniref:hypothetical protein n=1 Tax=Brevundimonas sp. SGAir0440 TaxID=2579977 RepID=UPI0010CD0065|nr:hypothetical protein [Brevundimonas sp. SGAir0440]QCQ97778.1 hypothetical protein E7T10_03380 [Brevundimonas sp. SGAir0440]
MTETEGYKKLLEANIASAASHADEVSKKWVTTLCLGNGAALLGCAAIVAPTENALALYRLLPSMWPFLLGVAAGFMAMGALGAAWRHDESEGRYEAANNTWRQIGEEGKVDEGAVNTETLAAKESRKFAAGCAITSMVAFLLGAGYPLVIATSLAIQGKL